MKDLGYFKEMFGREVALQHHLHANFYPPLPEPVGKAFVNAFKDYWAEKIDIYELETRLKDDAGYVGSLWDYDFDQFLSDDDLNLDGF
jgi:hypothetical protein